MRICLVLWTAIVAYTVTLFLPFWGNVLGIQAVLFTFWPLIEPSMWFRHVFWMPLFLSSLAFVNLWFVVAAVSVAARPVPRVPRERGGRWLPRAGLVSAVLAWSQWLVLPADLLRPSVGACVWAVSITLLAAVMWARRLGWVTLGQVGGNTEPGSVPAWIPTEPEPVGNGAKSHTEVGAIDAWVQQLGGEDSEAIKPSTPPDPTRDSVSGSS